MARDSLPMRPFEALCRIRPFGPRPTASRTQAGGGPVSFIKSEKRHPRAGRAAPIPSMLAAAGALDPADETFREYERVVDAKYLDQIRTQAKQFSTKRLSRQSGVARCAIMNFRREKTRSSRVLCESDKGHSSPGKQEHEELKPNILSVRPNNRAHFCGLLNRCGIGVLVSSTRLGRQ
jgi:hypothetical protein